MSKSDLIEILQGIINTNKENRNTAAIMILKSPKLASLLLNLVFEVENKNSIRATWVLGWICIYFDIHYLIPHLSQFTYNIKYLEFDSA